MFLAIFCLYGRSRFLDYDGFGSLLYFCGILRCLDGHSLRESTYRRFYLFCFSSAALFSCLVLGWALRPNRFLACFFQALNSWPKLRCYWKSLCYTLLFYWLYIVLQDRCYSFDLQLIFALLEKNLRRTLRPEFAYGFLYFHQRLSRSAGYICFAELRQLL